MDSLLLYRSSLWNCNVLGSHVRSIRAPSLSCSRKLKRSRALPFSFLRFRDLLRSPPLLSDWAKRLPTKWRFYSKKGRNKETIKSYTLDVTEQIKSHRLWLDRRGFWSFQQHGREEDGYLLGGGRRHQRLLFFAVVGRQELMQLLETADDQVLHGPDARPSQAR